MLSSRAAVGCGAIVLLVGCGGAGKATQGGATSGVGGGPEASAGAGPSSSSGTTGAGQGGAASSSAAHGSAASASSSSGSGQGGSLTIAPAPGVVDLGGKVLSAAQVQLIAYAEDPLAADVDAFITEFGTTTEWAAQTSEYGVGPFTKLPTVMLAGTPPTTLDDDSGGVTPFQQTLANNIANASSGFAPESGSTMYVFLLPQGTNISSGGNCCTDFLGYHYEAQLPSTNVPYAVVCDCGAQQGVSALEWVTTSVSHEMVEAATDPYFENNPAWAQTDDSSAIWTVVTGGEVADMCEDNTDENYLGPDVKYSIQRSWSNAAAKAGQNPCVPVPASYGPYFNSYAIAADAITLNYGGSWSTKGVKLAAGKTATIDVVLHSVAPTSGPWTVKAWDVNDYTGNGAATTTLSLNKDSGSDGDVLKLTITVKAYDPDFGGAGFILESMLGEQDNLTMYAVGQ